MAGSSIRLLRCLLVASLLAPQERSDPRAATPLSTGRKALAAGDRAEAIRHLRNALDYAPDSTEVLALLVDACAEDADAQALYRQALATAGVGANGRLALSADEAKRLPADDPRPADLAAARVAAVDELLKLAREKEKEGQSRPDALLVAQWARRVAFDLARDCPALMKAHADELSPRLSLPAGLPAKVVKSLEAFAASSLGSGRVADAIKAGRILAGLGVQLGWEQDLQGPKPAGVSGLSERAASLLERARAQLGNRNDEPWTIDELLQLDGDQAEAFTREHSTFANPGVAVSPRGWYRIETDCGFQTLLGVAQTIELHHQRLANWYGEDPFVGKPGLVRVVPEAAGLESEGTPFWWAGGFQGGDVTTMRFSCSSIEGLGHGLTHELTHRFDGAIYPGMPAWLMEGRAVWTGGAYGLSSDEGFVGNWASLGTIEAAMRKGYGDPNNLVKLLEGTIDDYRDNYTAGFALYVYLNTRKDDAGRVRFRERLEKFMKDARGTKKWKAKFEECFCDGRDGRPEGFDGFVADWRPWLDGFYWQIRSQTPWVKEYVEDVGNSGGPPVLDEPTWVWTRHRAEPRFGQEQAALAGNLLLDAGRRADGIAALVWALAVDGRRPAEEARLAAALKAENRRDAAWCLELGVEFPYGARSGPPPFAGATSRTRAFAEALGEAASDALARGHHVTAAALRCDRERVASWLGLERGEPSASPLAVVTPNHGFDPPSRLLAPNGWTETGLTDYEERRAKGRWYVDEDLDLHVGRDRPREATGIVDRSSPQVHCFALAPEWILPGTYRIDARIRFTTAYVDGAVILGFTEREQNLRVGFSAGDFLYAVGASDKEPQFTSMGWHVTGLRDRDGGLPGATMGGGVDFGGTASSFAISLLVDGALVEISINGSKVGEYHTVDGAAIEGQIGFATSMGAIEVHSPRVTRLERSRLAPAVTFEPTCFDLFSSRSLPPWSAQRRTCVGLPRLTQGTLLLWLAPRAEPFADDLARSAFLQKLQWDLRELATFVERARPTQKLVIAAPASVGEPGRQFLAQYAQRIFGDGAEVLLHSQPFVPDGVESPPSRRWLMFIDSAGIVRALSEIPSGLFVLDDSWFMRWINVFREHGHPERDLPPVERAEDGAEGDEGSDRS